MGSPKSSSSSSSPGTASPRSSESRDAAGCKASGACTALLRCGGGSPCGAEAAAAPPKMRSSAVSDDVLAHSARSAGCVCTGATGARRRVERRCAWCAVSSAARRDSRARCTSAYGMKYVWMSRLCRSFHAARIAFSACSTCAKLAPLPGPSTARTRLRTSSTRAK
eukprot:scaffold131480_cov69-Phaeocystis_antarctica.AAC.1